MHELAITQGFLTLALEEAKKAQGRRVTRINLVLGEMSGLKEESVRFCFDLVSKDSIAAGAVLSFGYMPGRDTYVKSIEVERINQFTDKLTPEVKQAIPKVLKLILKEIKG